MAENSSIKKYLSLDRLKEYDAKIKAKIEDGDAAIMTYINDDVLGQVISNADDIEDIKKVYLTTSDRDDFASQISNLKSHLENYIGDIPTGDDENPVAETVIDYIDTKNADTYAVADEALTKADDLIEKTVLGSYKDDEGNSHDYETVKDYVEAEVNAVNKSVDQKFDDFITAYITDDGGTIDKLNEIASWIVDDAAGAAKIIADVEDNTNRLDNLGTLASKGEVSYGDLDDALATRITTLESAIGESGSVADDIAAAKDEAIVAAAIDASNKDAVVLIEAQKAINAVQDNFNSSIEAFGSAAYASTGDFDADGSAATAEANAKNYTDTEIAKFEEITSDEIDKLFSDNTSN